MALWPGLYKNQDEAFGQLCGQMLPVCYGGKTALRAMDGERAEKDHPVV